MDPGHGEESRFSLEVFSKVTHQIANKGRDFTDEGSVIILEDIGAVELISFVFGESSGCLLEPLREEGLVEISRRLPKTFGLAKLYQINTPGIQVLG